MAEKKETRKILCEDLSPVEKALLLQTSMTPGFKVIIKMANEACLRATQDSAKLDPEMPDYDRVALERVRRSRNISEFSDLLFQSIFAHADSVKRQEASEHEEAEQAVDSVFGIHSAKVGESNDAVKKVFGIHSAKPKKQKQQSSQ
jgi:hypothetical protein